MTALTIWIIGYLYSLGIERKKCDKEGKAVEIDDALRMLVTWPCYLGYFRK